LYRFSLTIGLLYSSPKAWMFSTLVIILPYAFLRSLYFVVLLGKYFDISDRDLLRVFCLAPIVESEEEPAEDAAITRTEQQAADIEEQAMETSPPAIISPTSPPRAIPRISVHIDLGDDSDEGEGDDDDENEDEDEIDDARHDAMINMSATTSSIATAAAAATSPLRLQTSLLPFEMKELGIASLIGASSKRIGNTTASNDNNQQLQKGKGNFFLDDVSQTKKRKMTKRRKKMRRV